RDDLRRGRADYSANLRFNSDERCSPPVNLNLRPRSGFCRSTPARYGSAARLAGLLLGHLGLPQAIGMSDNQVFPAGVKPWN
ncbi:hypothetical protein, partial [Serpentinimonas barnesii]|uniref:hypothetical protein n=1 Tax=Serpentinimonas barnesii TaxID=1458427 RepID=UPI0019D6B773